MKKWITFLLILTMLIAIVFVAISISSSKDNGDDKSGENLDTGNDKTTGNVVNENTEDNISISGNAVGGGAGGSGGGSSGSSGAGGDGSGSNPETTPERKLPSDLYTQPCGYYFSEYNVCAGECPDGQCLIDERSCYCRIV